MKQYLYACNILNDIKNEYRKKSLKYGKFAYNIQLEEINRLKKIMKTLIIVLFCLCLMGCKAKDENLNKDVEEMFEFIQCPLNDSN